MPLIVPNTYTQAELAQRYVFFVHWTPALVARYPFAHMPTYALDEYSLVEIVEEQTPLGLVYNLHIYANYLPNYNIGYGTLSMAPVTLAVFQCSTVTLQNNRISRLYYQSGMQTFGSLMEIEAVFPNPPSVYIHGEYPLKYKVGYLTSTQNRHDVLTFKVHDDLYYVNTDERKNMRDAQYEQESVLAL